MGEVKPPQSVTVLEITIMARKEVAVKMRGHTMWLTTPRICPIMRVANIMTYETILIVASVVKTCEIESMSVILDAHITKRMNPSTFTKGSQKSKTIMSINRLRIYKNK